MVYPGATAFALQTRGDKGFRLPAPVRRGLGVYMKINYVNPDHVHAVVDMPTGLPIEELLKRFKGASSHWINQTNLVAGKFGWGRGYGVFSVSHSGIDEVAQYVATQEDHHRKRSFNEELRLLVERYGLTWRQEETVKTVDEHPAPGAPPH